MPPPPPPTPFTPAGSRIIPPSPLTLHSQRSRPRIKGPIPPLSPTEPPMEDIERVKEKVILQQQHQEEGNLPKEEEETTDTPQEGAVSAPQEGSEGIQTSPQEGTDAVSSDLTVEDI